MTLPHALRSDIKRATFHGLEGDGTRVAGIAARIDAALAEHDPADAPWLAEGIGEALHRIAILGARPRPGPFGRLAALVRARRRARLQSAAWQRHLTLPDRHPQIAWLCACDPEPAFRAAALAHLTAPPSPVHAALAAHARAQAHGGSQCTSD